MFGWVGRFVYQMTVCLLIVEEGGMVSVVVGVVVEGVVL